MYVYNRSRELAPLSQPFNQIEKEMNNHLSAHFSRNNNINTRTWVEDEWEARVGGDLRGCCCCCFVILVFPRNTGSVGGSQDEGEAEEGEEEEDGGA